ncbi:MAG: hypothetical protein R3C01_07765 [Planctomycetaceae bacterium]
MTQKQAAFEQPPAEVETIPASVMTPAENDQMDATTGPFFSKWDAMVGDVWGSDDSLFRTIVVEFQKQSPQTELSLVETLTEGALHRVYHALLGAMSDAINAQGEGELVLLKSTETGGVVFWGWRGSVDEELVTWPLQAFVERSVSGLGIRWAKECSVLASILCQAIWNTGEEWGSLTCILRSPSEVCYQWIAVENSIDIPADALAQAEISQLKWREAIDMNELTIDCGLIPSIRADVPLIAPSAEIEAERDARWKEEHGSIAASSQASAQS